MERRLAAILAADVVGYSRLMEADEAGTHAQLRALREELIDPTVAHHHGRIVKLTGDGALVEFPSVVQAVECAIAIQRAMAERNAQLAEDLRFVFRIGVNLGDVIVEADDIYGGGVNVAARLEGLAEPGGILISGTAYDQVEGRVDCGFAFTGEQTVKNIERPVRIYRVLLDAGARGVTSVASRPALSRRWWAGGAVAAVLLVVLGVVGWPQSWKSADEANRQAELASATLDPKRIAVLPFDNISASEDDAYFAEGMTEELIAQLSKIGQLSVIARTSILKYADSDKGIDEIGRELGVGTILEGSVRKAGDEIRITAQLIDVVSQAHMWSEKYDRRFDGIFAIQTDIAEQVADALQITLLMGEQEQIEDHGTDNIEAYNLYLQGLYFYNQTTKEGLRKSRRYFEQAIEKDPDYAKVHAKLADLYSRSLWHDYMSPEEVLAKQREAAEKALKLNESLAEAHAALASLKINAEWDWDGAERSVRKAIALNPSYARAHDILGHRLLSVVKRQHDEGIAELRRAVELDPWSPNEQEDLGWGYYHAERFDEALAQFRKAQEMFPDAPFITVGVAQSLAMKGLVEEAVGQMKRVVEIAPDNDWFQGFLAWAYGVAGRAEDARKVVEGLEVKAKEEPVPAMAMAWAYTGVGDKDKALEWLQEAYDKRDIGVIFMQAPEFRRVLADDPRYQELRGKLKLGGPDN